MQVDPRVDGCGRPATLLIEAVGTRGLEVQAPTVVERQPVLGGTCLNWGCIPTKALLRSAEILHFAQHAQDYGLKLAGTIEARANQAGAYVSCLR